LRGSCWGEPKGQIQWVGGLGGIGERNADVPILDVRGGTWDARDPSSELPEFRVVEGSGPPAPEALPAVLEALAFFP
jgi:hypothetical protein